LADEKDKNEKVDGTSKAKVLPAKVRRDDKGKGECKDPCGCGDPSAITDSLKRLKEADLAGVKEIVKTGLTNVSREVRTMRVAMGQVKTEVKATVQRVSRLEERFKVHSQVITKIQRDIVNIQKEITSLKKAATSKPYNIADVKSPLTPTGIAGKPGRPGDGTSNTVRDVVAGGIAGGIAAKVLPYAGALGVTAGAGLSAYLLYKQNDFFLKKNKEYHDRIAREGDKPQHKEVPDLDLQKLWQRGKKWWQGGTKSQAPTVPPVAPEQKPPTLYDQMKGRWNKGGFLGAPPSYLGGPKPEDAAPRLSGGRAFAAANPFAAIQSLRAGYHKMRTPNILGRAWIGNDPGVHDQGSFLDQYERRKIEDQKAEFMKFGKLPSGFEFLPGHMGRLGTPDALRAAGIQPYEGGGVNSIGTPFPSAAPGGYQGFPTANPRANLGGPQAGIQANEPQYTGQNSGYIEERRARFAKELEQNPELRRQAIWAAWHENNKSTDAMQNVFESMLNRADMRGITLRQAIMPTHLGGEGFYGPVNRTGGRFGSLNDQQLKMGEEALNRVIKGSNTIGFRTDQGMVTDPGGRFYAAHPEYGWKKIGGENYYYNRSGGVGRHIQRIEGAEKFRTGIDYAREMERRSAEWEAKKGGQPPQPQPQQRATASTTTAPPTDDRIPNKTRLPGGQEAMADKKDFAGTVFHKTPLSLKQLLEGGDPRNKTFGYHTAIDQEGNVHELRGYDIRPNQMKKATEAVRTEITKHLDNRSAYGVALLGGQLTDKQKEAMKNHFAGLVAKGILPKDFGKNLPAYGHGEAQPDEGRDKLDKGRKAEGSEAAAFLNENWADIVKRASGMPTTSVAQGPASGPPTAAASMSPWGIGRRVMEMAGNVGQQVVSGARDAVANMVNGSGYDPRSVTREQNLARPTFQRGTFSTPWTTTPSASGGGNERFPSVPWGAYNLMRYRSGKVGDKETGEAFKVVPFGSTGSKEHQPLKDPITENRRTDGGPLRAGVAVHVTAGSNPRRTQGCLSIPETVWPRIKADIMRIEKEHGVHDVVLVSGPQGWQVMPKKQYEEQYPPGKAPVMTPEQYQAQTSSHIVVTGQGMEADTERRARAVFGDNVSIFPRNDVNGVKAALKANPNQTVTLFSAGGAMAADVANYMKSIGADPKNLRVVQHHNSADESVRAAVAAGMPIQNVYAGRDPANGGNLLKDGATLSSKGTNHGSSVDEVFRAASSGAIPGVVAQPKSPAFNLPPELQPWKEDKAMGGFTQPPVLAPASLPPLPEKGDLSPELRNQGPPVPNMALPPELQPKAPSPMEGPDTTMPSPQAPVSSMPPVPVSDDLASELQPVQQPSASTQGPGNNQPGNGRTPGAAYPHNPDSRPESPGSAGAGSYGRCFV